MAQRPTVGATTSAVLRAGPALGARTAYSRSRTRTAGQHAEAPHAAITHDRKAPLTIPPAKESVAGIHQAIKVQPSSQDGEGKQVEHGDNWCFKHSTAQRVKQGDTAPKHGTDQRETGDGTAKGAGAWRP